MNRKGQVLVLFVLVLPLILLFVFCLFEKLYVSSEKNKIYNLSNSVCDYLKENNDIDKAKNMIIDNDKDILIDNIFIEIVNDKITIEINKNIKGLFGYIFDNNSYSYKSKVTCRRTYEKE